MDEIEFNWDKKQLGVPGLVPDICPMCSARMCDSGWNVNGEFITCYSCRQVFKNGDIIKDE